MFERSTKAGVALVRCAAVIALGAASAACSGGEGPAVPRTPSRDLPGKTQTERSPRKNGPRR